MTSYEHTSTDRSSSFASPDETTKASLSVGEALLSWYSLALSLAMKQFNDQFRSDQTGSSRGTSSSSGGMGSTTSSRWTISD